METPGTVVHQGVRYKLRSLSAAIRQFKARKRSGRKSVAIIDGLHCGYMAPKGGKRKYFVTNGIKPKGGKASR